MFNFLKKKRKKDPLLDFEENLEHVFSFEGFDTSLTKILNNTDSTSLLLKGTMTALNELLNELKARRIEGSEWLVRFHQLLLNDLVQGPHDIVYGLAYVNKLSSKRRLVLAAVDKLEQALEVGNSILTTEEGSALDWTVEGYQNINIPRKKEVSVEAINEELKLGKPVQMYVNELMLARDRFAETKSEKLAFTKVIKKIQTQYAATSSEK